MGNLEHGGAPEVVEVQGCIERHKRIDGILDGHERWLSDHEAKIDRLDRNDATNTAEIGGLCKQIKELVAILKWLIGILVTTILGSLVGFFFYAVQNHLFKP